MESFVPLPPAGVYRQADALVRDIPPDRRLRNALAMIALGIVLGAGGVLAIEHRSGGASVDRTPREVAYAPVGLATAPRPRSKDRLVRAQEAALLGEPAAVRALLENVVRSGHGRVEEARLLREACKMMGDRQCVVDVDTLYPRPSSDR